MYMFVFLNRDQNIAWPFSLNRDFGNFDSESNLYEDWQEKQLL